MEIRNLRFRKRDLIPTYAVFYCFSSLFLGFSLGIEQAILKGMFSSIFSIPIAILMFGVITIPLTSIIFIVVCLILRFFSQFNLYSYTFAGIIGSFFTWYLIGTKDSPHYLVHWPWYHYLVGGFIGSYLSFKALESLSTTN